MKKLMFLMACLFSNIVQSSDLAPVRALQAVFEEDDGSSVSDAVFEEDDGSSVSDDAIKTLGEYQDKEDNVTNKFNNINDIVQYLGEFSKQSCFRLLQKEGGYKFCTHYEGVVQNLKKIHDEMKIMFKTGKDNNGVIVKLSEWNQIWPVLCSSKLMLHNSFNKDRNKKRMSDRSSLLFNSEHLEFLRELHAELLNMTCTILNHGGWVKNHHQKKFKVAFAQQITFVTDGVYAVYVPDRLLHTIPGALQGTIIITHRGLFLVS